MGYKICPICGTAAHEQASICGVCGASLDKLPESEDARAADPKGKPQPYDFHYGETDLAEGNLKWRGGTYILVIMLMLAVAACVAGGYIGTVRVMSAFGLIPPTLTPAVTDTPQNEAVDPNVTPTASPTLFLPTVTVAEPTEVIIPTETPGPCMQTVQTGDSLIAIVSRCGHRDLAVLDEVLDLNNMSSADMLQLGQEIAVPWPTSTPDPVQADPEDADDSMEGAASDGGETITVADTSDENVPDPFFRPTATLQAGVMWHTVASGENIIVIAYQYNANVKVLSELNPEVTFSQCDFGDFGGGGDCTVFLSAGQRLRVPAPTPTPTLSPTPSGSETPTPSPTATFNAPSAMSPSNRMLFLENDLITLRWVASGTLGLGQVYQVQVEDVSAGLLYTADTTDLFYIIPEDWQAKDGTRHEYRWVVSVVDIDDRENPYFTTESRTFSWEGVDET